MADDPVSEVPVTVDVLRFCAREFDDDGLLLAYKAVRDVIFNRRLTPNDTPKWMRWGTTEQIVAPKWSGSQEWSVFIVKRRAE